ncbi:MAG: CBS domain-containing protein [Chloroflexota bacterium]
MNIEKFMKKNVISIPITSTIRDAITVFIKKRVSILPVVNPQGKPVGVVRLSNLVSLEMPDFIKFVEDFDFVHDFGAIESMQPSSELLSRSITTIMQPVDTIDKDCGLMRVYAIMLKDEIFDLPVTNEKGELVGIVSRVDIGTGILTTWSTE